MNLPNSILILGGGNMGAALAKRWRVAFPSTAIHVVDPNTDKRALLAALGCQVHGTLAGVAHPVDAVVLAIKPQQYAALRDELATCIATDAGPPVVMSIMAGVTLDALSPLSPNVARIMPNTPSLIGEGMSAICAPKLSEAHQEMVKALFGAAGHVVMIAREELMHAVTAISGSGPAYLFAFMEALENAAMDLGLDATTARALVTQTIRGAALLADQSGGDAARLRAQVTSPGGTTEAALAQFAQGGLDALVKAATKAAEARSEELAN